MNQYREKIMEGLLALCGFVAVAAVIGMTFYMTAAGLPAIREIGGAAFWFGTQWEPTADPPAYGVGHLILTSIVGTSLAVLLSVPIGILTAVFLAELAPPVLCGIVRPAVEILAGIPSVVYGLLGTVLVVPWVQRLELWLYGGNENHRFTGGANLFSAALVLAVMILPTVVTVCGNALHAVPAQLREASLALGASRTETIFRITLPAARSGITAGVVLGVGRAVGEAMAVMMVSGNVVRFPGLFRSVRFLTTGIVTEMGYASGLHRQALFSVGLVLFWLLLPLNLLPRLLQKGADDHATIGEPAGWKDSRI